jgi:site-specific recombinase XerD
MKKPTDLSILLSKFLSEELPMVRNSSKNTITSYRDTYVLLLKYADESKQIKAERLQIRDITKDFIVDFLLWLEQERGSSISTRNQRLAAIRALFRYIQTQAPEYMFQSQQILALPSKKCAKVPVKYLSIDETKAILASPDATSKKGRRDQAILSLLYDSGARVQELADVKIMDLRFETPAQIALTGKGRKTRVVPLMEKTVVILERYMIENGLKCPTKIHSPLFFNCHGKALTRQGIAYILSKYAQVCQIDNVFPHRVRHTKALHLTEADINPIYIRDFLGHTDLKVTEIYSKASIGMKKRALEKLSGEGNPIPEEPPDWNGNKSLMDWLLSFGR